MLDPWASSVPPTGAPQVPLAQPFGSPFYSQVSGRHRRNSEIIMLILIAFPLRFFFSLLGYHFSAFAVRFHLFVWLYNKTVSAHVCQTLQ
jgi:hypothetical protein